MLKTESYKKGIVKSTALNIVAKSIGFINSLILAFYFGASASTDIYFYVLSVAALITNTVNGIDYLVLIPEAMKLRETKGEKSSQQFLNFFIWLYAAIGILITIFIVLSPVLFFNLFSKFDRSQLQDHSQLLYIGCIIIVFQLLNNLMSAILVSYKYFTMPIITGLVNSIFAITLTLVFHKQLGITGTILGISAGYVVNFILLLVQLKKYHGWEFLKVHVVKVKRVWRNIGLIQVNILPVWIRNYIILYLLSGLGTGIITSVNLGQMLATMPEIFILTQITSVVGIKFSELAAKEDYKETSRVLSNVLSTLFVLLIPVAIAMAVAHKEIIAIVFQRGHFTASSAATTAFCFFYFALILPSKIYDVTFTRLFTSFQVYGLSTLAAVIGHSIITVITFFAIKQFNLTGYFISIMIGYYIIMPVISLFVLHFGLKKMDTKAVVKSFLIALITIPAVFFLCNYLYQLLHFHYIVNIGIISIVSLVSVLVICNYTMNLEYFWTSVRQMRRRLKLLLHK